MNGNWNTHSVIEGISQSSQYICREVFSVLSFHCWCCALANASRLMAFAIGAIFCCFCNCFFFSPLFLPTSHDVAYWWIEQVFFLFRRKNCIRSVHLNDVVCLWIYWLEYRWHFFSSWLQFVAHTILQPRNGKLFLTQSIIAKINETYELINWQSVC